MTVTNATVDTAAKEIAAALRNQPVIDLTPIAEAIRDGLTAIGTAIEVASLNKKPIDLTPIAEAIESLTAESVKGTVRESLQRALDRDLNSNSDDVPF